MKPGQRVYLGKQGRREMYVVEYIGSHTVRLRRPDGVIRVIKHREARKAGLDIPRKKRLRTISTPMGGQPPRR